jgi:hypothetical protein
VIFLKIWSNYGYWKSQKPLDYSILAIYIYIARKKRAATNVPPWMDGWDVDKTIGTLALRYGNAG